MRDDHAGSGGLNTQAQPDGGHQSQRHRDSPSNTPGVFRQGAGHEPLQVLVAGVVGIPGALGIPHGVKEETGRLARADNPAEQGDGERGSHHGDS